uniref:BLOC-1-related complex subunit 7 n=1 Tax=Caenorhabditis tropicalis TaxID=1561998 RepID=A0A1I7TF65_9PELO
MRHSGKVPDSIAKTISKIHVSKAQINSVIMCMQEQLVTMRMAVSLQKSTEVMKSRQQLVKVPEIMKTMREMSAEMMKLGRSREYSLGSYPRRAWKGSTRCQVIGGVVTPAAEDFEGMDFAVESSDFRLDECTRIHSATFCYKITLRDHFITSSLIISLEMSSQGMQLIRDRQIQRPTRGGGGGDHNRSEQKEQKKKRRATEGNERVTTMNKKKRRNRQ